MTATFVMSYDIACDTNRSRVLRLMRKLAVGYQNSVFEMEGSETEIHQLLCQTAALLTPETDRLMLLGGSVFTRQWQLGRSINRYSSAPFFILM